MNVQSATDAGLYVQLIILENITSASGVDLCM